MALALGLFILRITADIYSDCELTSSLWQINHAHVIRGPVEPTDGTRRSDLVATIVLEEADRSAGFCLECWLQAPM